MTASAHAGNRLPLAQAHAPRLIAWFRSRLSGRFTDESAPSWKSGQELRIIRKLQPLKRLDGMVDARGKVPERRLVTPVRRAQIKELFRLALETPESERSRFLDSACGEDRDLRTEVERLLEGNEEP